MIDQDSYWADQQDQQQQWIEMRDQHIRGIRELEAMLKSMGVPFTPLKER